MMPWQLKFVHLQALIEQVRAKLVSRSETFHREAPFSLLETILSRLLAYLLGWYIPIGVLEEFQVGEHCTKAILMLERDMTTRIVDSRKFALPGA
jgi:hypothetical protein